MYSSKVGEVTKEIQFLCHNSKAKLLRGGKEGGRGREEGEGRREEGGRREGEIATSDKCCLLPIPAAVLVQFQNGGFLSRGRQDFSPL